jgi:signal transduction histidine kinase
MTADATDRVRILIVDDHDENLLALEAVLTDPQYELVRANSGRAALRAALQSDFALVLLDVAMPDMDGYETATLLRERERSRNIPIIFLTANYRGEGHVFRGYSVGAVDYLFKPFSPEVLKSKVAVFVELFQKREALKRQAEALQRAHDELEERVDQRTAQLAAATSLERDLRGQAEQANRLKDEFLATLSHELRTPLNAILGWTHLLALPTGDPEMAAHAVTVIKNNAVAQSQIIEDILDVSRIIGGKLRLRLTHVSLEQIVTAAIDAVRPAADAKGITIDLDLATTTPIVMDGDRMQQVCWNLLSNAVKFTPKGGHVSVVLEERASDLVLCVEDSGMGIAREFLPQIFDRFSQADSSAGRRHGGLGLGMAIVRHLVELHGGTVEAASEGPGRGAKFTVVLPRRTTLQADSSEPPASDAQLSLPQGALPDLDGRQVLVVDDEADNLEFLGLLLRQAGAHTHLARSGAAALQLLETHDVDIIVSDLEMPDMDGCEFLRQVQRRPGRARIPAIAVTAHVRAEQGRAALDAGYDLHVAKPVDVVQLATAIDALTSMRGTNVP